MSKASLFELCYDEKKYKEIYCHSGWMFTSNKKVTVKAV